MVEEIVVDQIDEEGNYTCSICGHKVESKEVEKEILTANLGGLIIMICPACLGLQVPRKVFNLVRNRAKSSIIAP